MKIRVIMESDGEQFLHLGRSLDQETRFMMLSPGERKITIDEQRQRIKNILSQDNQIIFVAGHEGRLVGFMEAVGGEFQRNRHCVYIVIGILQEFAGRGIGKRFFETLEEWALARSLHRLELTVMKHNERALHLYQKMGFEIEGIKRDSLWVDGKYVDEYYMAKLIGP